MTHTIRIVHTGTHNALASPNVSGDYLVQMIRERLEEGSIVPPSTRYDATCDCIQVTSDGGAHWTDSGFDPRTDAGYRVPARTGADKACQASGCMTDFIAQWLGDVFLAVNVSAIGTATMVDLALLSSGIGFLAGLAVITAEALVALGLTAIQAAFTSTVYDTLTCIFYCHVDSDGQLSNAALGGALIDIDTQIGGLAGTVLHVLFTLMGAVMLSNAGTRGTSARSCAGCSTCGWFVEYDFSLGLFGWQALVNAGVAFGSFNGADWAGTKAPTQVELYLYKDLTGTHVTGVSFYGNNFTGTGLGHLVRINDLTSLTPPGGVQKSSATYSSHAPSNQWWTLWTGGFVITVGLGVRVSCDTNGTGSITTLKMRLSGTGTPPTDGKFVTSL